MYLSEQFPSSTLCKVNNISRIATSLKNMLIEVVYM